jgi:hypothetical protein
MLEGLSMTHQWSDDPIILQSDCSNDLVALQDKRRNTSVYGHLYEETECLINLCDVLLVKVTREQK